MTKKVIVFVAVLVLPRSINMNRTQCSHFVNRNKIIFFVPKVDQTMLILDDLCQERLWWNKINQLGLL